MLVIFRNILLAGTATCTIFADVHAQFIEQRKIDYPEEGVVLGNGWLSLAASKTAGRCVDFDVFNDPSEDTVSSLKRVVDKENLNQQLDVSVEFQAKAISGLGGSVKAKYSNSLEVKNESLNLAVTARVAKGADFVIPKAGTTGIKLTDDAAKLANTDMPAFLKQCGDTFVAAIHSGGELNALLTFDVNSTDERETVAAAMEVGGLNFSGNTSSTQTMSRYRQSSKLQILMHSAGGSGQAIPVDEATLLTALQNLPANAKNAPKPYKISVARYDQLGNWPTATLQATKFSEMEELVGQYYRYSTLYYDLDPIVSNNANYVFVANVTPASINNMQDHIKVNILPALKKGVQECLAGNSCVTPDVGKPIDYELRSAIPVPLNSFAEDIQLRKFIALRDAAQIDFNNQPATVPMQIPTGTDFLGRILTTTIQVENKRKTDLGREIAGYNASIVAAQATYPVALSKAMLLQWVDTPSKFRCANNPVTRYCLSRSEVDNYGRKIRTLLNISSGATAGAPL